MKTTMPIQGTNTNVDDPGFARVARPARMSDEVSTQLVAFIESERLPAGSRLPSERELGEQFGVSRTVIREALRSVAAKGLIDSRGGSGLHVATVGGSQVTESMRGLLRGHRGIDYRHINEVRTVLETATTRAAAERATDEEIRELRTLHEQMVRVVDDVGAASAADVEFHRAIARSTQNELFVVLLDSIGDVLLEIRRATLGIPGRPEVGVRYHGHILARIQAHDPDGAELAMREHLGDAVEAWRDLQLDDGAGAR